MRRLAPLSVLAVGCFVDSSGRCPEPTTPGARKLEKKDSARMEKDGDGDRPLVRAEWDGTYSSGMLGVDLALNRGIYQSGRAGVPFVVRVSLTYGDVTAKFESEVSKLPEATAGGPCRAKLGVKAAAPHGPAAGEKVGVLAQLVYVGPDGEKIIDEWQKPHSKGPPSPPS